MSLMETEKQTQKNEENNKMSMGPLHNNKFPNLLRKVENFQIRSRKNRKLK